MQGRASSFRWLAAAVSAAGIVATAAAPRPAAPAPAAPRASAPVPAMPLAPSRLSATRPAPASLPSASPAASAGAAPELDPWCVRLAAQVPGLAHASCVASGLAAGDGRSVRGVPLWSRDVVPAGGPARFRVLLLGGIHGDELTSVALAFDWIARSHAARALPGVSSGDIAWRIVPLLNPDGLLHAPATRVNAHGVDLNRNFPTADWARDAQPYWIRRTNRDPRRFPGPRPLSEPESRWLLGQIEAFRPDLIVSVHAPYGLLDFDGPPPAPRRLGDLALDPVGVYPGSLGNYGGLVRRLPVMTLELRDAGRVSPAEFGAMWDDLQRWIAQRLAQRGTRAAAAP
jgi:hypothetical protein